MLETTTATAKDGGVDATIVLSSRLENPETTFTITLNEGGATAAGATVKKFDGKTKVPGGPSTMAVVRACMFDLTTRPEILKVDQEKQPDGKTKVTIKALITAKEYEDREYDSSERKRFRLIEFIDSSMNIGADSNVRMNARPTETNNIEMEIVYDI